MDELELLRLHAEPCVHFHELQIHQALMNNIHQSMDELESFYFAWQKNRRIVQMPRKLVFKTDGLKGDMRVMPCIIDSFKGEIIKAVKIIGTNEEERIIEDKIAVGKALLIDPTDNFVKGIFDVCALSSFRTAAISVLAFKHSVDDVHKQKTALVGTGRVGFYTASILQRWLGIKEMKIYDIDKERMDSFSKLFGSKVTIKKNSFRDLCRSSSAVFLATTSSEPLLNARDTENIQFISSVGADADNLSELHSDLYKKRMVISESRQNVYFGDLNRWHKSGLFRKKDLLELRDVIGRYSFKKQPVMFISTGTAIQDALICQFLFKKLNRA